MTRPIKRERQGSRTNAPFAVDVEKAIDAYSDTVFRLALRRTSNKADAEDVLQNVFIKLLNAKGRIADEGHLKAWLLRTTINCSNDVLRKRGRSTPLAECAGMDDYGLTDEELALHDAVEDLPLAQRTAIHLFYFEGYRTEEIASITGESSSTVRSHLHRARKALRIRFEDGGIRE